MSKYNRYYVLYGTAAGLARYSRSSLTRISDVESMSRPFYTYIIESKLEEITLNIDTFTWTRCYGYDILTDKKVYERVYGE